MSCSTKSNLDDSSEKQNIKEFDVDDPRVSRAKKVAQDSMSYYIDYFRRFYGQENYKFFLKSAISDSNDIEHMWLKPFSLDDNGFNCILDNEPMTITNHKLGDTIQIRLSDIEDVIIVTADTTIIGHYFEKELKKYQRSETGPGREQ
jgi:uncharacterized protein YegJ (DUF2314 family)